MKIKKDKSGKYGDYAHDVETRIYDDEDLRKLEKEARIKVLQKKLKKVNRELAAADEKGDEEYYQTLKQYADLYKKHLDKE